MQKRKQKKKARLSLLALFLVLFCASPLPGKISEPVTVEAHSGRTDANGGHRDNKNVSGLGYYHYHCGGHPAHLHPNGVCPYSRPVTPAKPAPKLNRTNAQVKLGKTLSLRLSNASGTVKWTSTNPKIASVKNGKVTPKKAGTCTITAVYNGKAYKCRVTVKNPLLFSEKVLYLEVGDQLHIPCNMKASLASWESSNQAIAFVTRTGYVTARRAGTCTITAKYKGKTQKCKLIIDDPYEDMEDDYF